ncbi:hypothetical protein NEOLI_000884 [Neolecta irregularis DAH-3]|uniref:Uncharacterized protein n=1 Tax=Neolecta irregularis (strain DAH-3) TaxID=1198029 RepID=A0A1U7LT59_NEOID|nr:hypothetical protein NEOLI_000884 [Neolecta irregularis DAH-3]|eukprot:OLL25701.1 hypothetical protein NEOLI_000884 [Neolecta irregularis DAH-3]
MSISCGTAGNAEEAAKAALPPDLNPANFAEMSQEDIQVIHQERLNAEEAETSCFVPLLKSLKSGDPKYDELYGGLIANKVLKL